MSGQGTARNTRKVEYVPPYEFQNTLPRAGKKLREQARNRTIMETRNPHQVWGIEGLVAEFRLSANKEHKLTAKALAAEAQVRLSLLRAVNI